MRIGNHIYLKNGETEYIFGDKREQFRRIIQERLGEDAVQLFDYLCSRTNDE